MKVSVVSKPDKTQTRRSGKATRPEKPKQARLDRIKRAPRVRGKDTYMPEVIEFCERHGGLPSVAEATKLVEECFPSRRALHIRLDHDPEEAGEWIVIEVTMGQDVGDFLETYNRCVSLWSERISPESLALIRLSYNLA